MIQIILMAVSAFSAVPKTQDVSVLKALNTKPVQRVAVIKKSGKKGVRELRQIAFGSQYTVEQRWHALSTLAIVGGKDFEPELEKAIKSSDWFMRDASLKAFEKINPPKAKKWAKHLLSDPALVVRSSAVRVIKNLNDDSVKPLLWEKLNAPQNFRGNQSLWVRGDIVEALSQFAQPGEESKFVTLLSDNDKRLHKPASLALRRLTGITPLIREKNLKAEISYWKNWWSRR